MFAVTGVWRWAGLSASRCAFYHQIIRSYSAETKQQHDPVPVENGADSDNGYSHEPAPVVTQHYLLTLDKG